MARIENISDQVYPYSTEAAWCIQQLQKDFDLDFRQAATAVALAEVEMFVDVLHHIDHSLNLIADNTD